MQTTPTDLQWLLPILIFAGLIFALFSFSAKYVKLDPREKKGLYSRYVSMSPDVLQSILQTSLLYTEGSVDKWRRELHSQGWTLEATLLAVDEWRAVWDWDKLADKKHA